MRYICKTIQEVKYLEKILNTEFTVGLYSRLNETNYISIFDNGYCSLCCEICIGSYSCDRQDYLINYNIVSNMLREEKLKKIMS